MHNLIDGTASDASEASGAKLRADTATAWCIDTPWYAVAISRESNEALSCLPEEDIFVVFVLATKTAATRPFFAQQET